jgi:hypothetical protein
VAGALTYKPRTETGREYPEGAGKVLAPLAALTPAEMALAGRAASSANTGIRGLAVPSAAVQDAADAATVANGTRGTLRELASPPKSTLAGVGAAATPEVVQRVERAAALPVPVKLTKASARATLRKWRLRRKPPNNRRAHRCAIGKWSRTSNFYRISTLSATKPGPQSPGSAPPAKWWTGRSSRNTTPPKPR